MLTRRGFLAASAAQFQYDSLRWVDEREDPSLTIETEELVAKIIDNTGLRPRPGSHWMEPNYTHHFGYHGIRALWQKDERRNIVAPFYSWLTLQMLRVEGLERDPIDSRAMSGVGRGWPMRMEKQGAGVLLKIPRMPVSGIEYDFHVRPSGPDSLDFEVRFTLHKKTREPAKFLASWPCYMSTFDEVQLHVPAGDPDRPTWRAFGDREPFVIGETVNYVHSQRGFSPPAPLAFPAVFGRIGSRVLALMVSRPEVRFYLINAGGHRSYYPVQNPAWDFALELPDYEVGRPFGFKGRLLYKGWDGAGEIAVRYRQWRAAEP